MRLETDTKLDFNNVLIRPKKNNTNKQKSNSSRNII